MTKRTLIIAEAGVNHNGDLAIAKQLIDAAAQAGADLVKFQTFIADSLVTRTARKAEYQNHAADHDESQHEMLRQLELSAEMHEKLIAHCALRNIGFFSTAFDMESIELLLSFGQEHFKVPSGEITNLPYLQKIGRSAKSVILSSGMATLGEVEAAIEVLEHEGMPRSRITVLHCTTEYPAPMSEVNLRAMQNMGVALGVAVGYSDHTLGIEVPIAAAALGATVIEKHFTLDRAMQGPDHKASLEPDELEAMVSAIRNIEMAMGDGIKRISASERKNRPIARKSLVALKPIMKGEVFSDANLTVKRPGYGISPMDLESVIGRYAIRNFATDELIEI